jgi:hypothetical protein
VLAHGGGVELSHDVDRVVDRGRAEERHVLVVVVRDSTAPVTGQAGDLQVVHPGLRLEYLLAKTAETVWEAVSAGQSEFGPNFVPVRNYMTALAAKVGISPARDFALGMLTERVRQEEDGWPDHPGDPRGLRTGHGTGASHLCLLERKHQVEDAIYQVEPTLLGRRADSCG